MRPFTVLTAVAAPLEIAKIDTGMILPGRFMRRHRRPGHDYADAFLHDLRFDEAGRPRADFVLNLKAYRDAKILLTGGDFGCGSSREGAVWSLQEMGIRAVIGSGFGDIFFANCFQNGILPIVLDKAIVDSLASEIEATQGAGRIGIDLEAQTISSPSGKQHHFEIDPRRREGLLLGLDEVALTLQRDDEIRAFQAADRSARPWIYLARKSA